MAHTARIAPWPSAARAFLSQFLPARRSARTKHDRPRAVPPLTLSFSCLDSGPEKPLPFCLPTCLPAYLPSSFLVPSFLPSPFLPSFLLPYSFLPSFLPPSLFLPSFLPPSLFFPSYFLPPSSFLPPSLSTMLMII